MCAIGCVLRYVKKIRIKYVQTNFTLTIQDVSNVRRNQMTVNNQPLSQIRRGGGAF